MARSPSAFALPAPQGVALSASTTAPSAAVSSYPPGLLARDPHPRRLGWIQTTALAMGGSNQSLFLLGALLIAQGSAAVPLLIVGLVLSWMALPGWIELVMMWPNRVGGIAATCAEAFRPYSAVLANLTGVCYWWGWVPTCGLTALLSASALHSWVLPGVNVTALAVAILLLFTVVNLCGVQWVARLAVPMAATSATLAFLSATVPVFAGHVDWHQALNFHLITPYGGVFGKITSAMAGLYLVGFAAPAFEAASCHVGETRDPERNVPRAMFASAGMASLYFVILPIIWLGTIGEHPLSGDLASALGPTFAPLLGGLAKSAAILFMVFNMFHGTLQPLAGASRTLSQLAEDGLLPRMLEWRLPISDAPWTATLLTSGMSILFLLAGDPTWLVAAANLTYLIGISLPNVAVYLLRKDEPDLPRPYRSSNLMLRMGLVAAVCWMVSAVLGFEQYGLPTVLFGLALAYSGSVFYAWRAISDRRRTGVRSTIRSMHLKLTGAMLLVLTLDGVGYLLAIDNITTGEGPLVSALKDLFVAVALLTISVGLVLPGMIAHASGQVMLAADRLASGTLRDLTDGLAALARADLDAAHAVIDERRVVVHSKDEIGAMADSFNVMLGEAARAAHSLDVAREQLRLYTDNLGDLVVQRTAELEAANRNLQGAQLERRRLLNQSVKAMEDERTTIAADLHDGPIQRLAAVGLLLDRAILRAERGDADGAAARALEAQSELKTEIEALRRLMAGLRPPVLDEGGLVAALTDYATAFCGLAGLAVELDLAEVALDKRRETTLYRIAQAALTNTVRHAEANTVRIRLTPAGQSVELVVGDDGCGFDTALMGSFVRNGHYGLAGMRERAEMADGNLVVSSKPGSGTQVLARVPLGHTATTEEVPAWAR
jgi:signal transduction histidine kinase